MALARIKKGDMVKVTTGKYKGKVASVTSVLVGNKVLLKGINERKRHHAANRIAPAGKRDIQLPIDSSNVVLVTDEKTNKTSRVGVKTDPKGKRVRVAVQQNNKEIK